MNLNFSKINFDTDNGPFKWICFNPDLANNPNVQQYFQNKEFERIIAKELNEKSLSRLPFSSHLEAKSFQEILYSHPDYINKAPEMDGLANVNEYRSLPPDSTNKWYENFDFHNFQYFNYIHFLYKCTDEKLSEDIEKKIKNFKTKCEENFNDISQNEQLKEKYIHIKLLINNLQSTNAQNLTDSLEWVSIISTDVKSTLEHHQKLIVLLRHDLHELFVKLQNLLKTDLNDEQRLLLAKIIFFASEAFESFHGLMLLVDTLEKYNLQNKFFENFDWDSLLKQRRLCRIYDSNSSQFSKIEKDYYLTKDDFLKTVEERNFIFNFDSRWVSYFFDDEIFFFNQESGLIKCKFVNDEKIVYVNKNSKTPLIQDKEGSSNYHLFSFNNNLIAFNVSKFKTEENKFTFYDKDTLFDVEGQIVFDDAAQMIFNSRDIPEEIKPKLNKYKSLSPDHKFSNTNLAFNSKNNFIYLTYPIAMIEEEDEERNFYFSKTYIYICDIFSLTGEGSSVYINYVKSVVLKNDHEDPLCVLDDIFESHDKKKFFINSGILSTFKNKFGYNLIHENKIDSNLIFFGARNNNLTELVVDEGKSERFFHIRLENNDNYNEIAKDFSKINVDFELSTIHTGEHINGCGSTRAFSIMLKEAKIDLSQKKNANKDIFTKLFLLDYEDSSDNSKTNSNIPAEGANIDYCNHLLMNLALASTLKTNITDNLEGSQMITFFKFPCLINLEYPTFKLLTNLLKVFADKARKVLWVLILLRNHLKQVIKLNFDIKIIFRKEEDVTSLIDLLTKFVNNGKDNRLDTEISTIASQVLFDLLAVSYTKYERVEISLINIFTKDLDLTELNTQTEVTSFINNFMNFSSNHLTILKNPVLNRSFLNLVSGILAKENEDFKSRGIKSRNTCNYDLPSIVNSFYLFTFQRFLSKVKPEDNFSHIKESAISTFYELNEILLSSLADFLLYVQKYLEENKYTKEDLKIFISSKSINFKLVNILCMYCNLFEVDNLFVNKSWARLVNVVSMLSTLRETDVPRNNTEKIDIIIDNTFFESNSELKDVDKSLPFTLKKFETEESLVQDLFIQFSMISGEDNATSVMKITSSGDDIFAIEHQATKGYNQFYSIIHNVDMNKLLKISIDLKKSESTRKFIKIRVANYKFFDVGIDIHLNPILLLLNKVLKFMLFYHNAAIENSLSITPELLDLYNTQIFSGGITSEALKSDFDTESLLTNDLRTFTMETKKSSSHFADKLQPILEMQINPDHDKEVHENTFEDLVCLQKDKLKNYQKLFSIFDKLMKHVYKEFIFVGEFPDKFMRAAFFTVIRHLKLNSLLEETTSKIFNGDEPENAENLLKTLSIEEILDLQNEESFEVLFYIWRESNSLRKFYKAKKDELLKDEKNTDEDIEKYFNIVLKKIEFLFYLSVNEEKELLLQKNSSGKKKNKTAKTFKRKITVLDSAVAAIQGKIKTNLLTVIHVATSETLKLESMSRGFEYMNLKAKFREVHLVILTDLLSSISDKEIKANLLSNFYESFRSFQVIPRIFEEVNCSSTKIRDDISYAFHNLLYSIIDEVNNSDSIFYTCTLLNCLSWNIRGRDFPFLLESKFFTDLYKFPNNKIIKAANEMLFFFPEVKESHDESIKYFNLAETRGLDLCHVAKSLTDILCIYSNLVLKRVLLEKRGANKRKFGSSDSGLSLLRIKSSLGDNSLDLLSVIFEIYELQFDKMLNLFLLKENQELNMNDIKKYTFPIKNENIIKYNIQYNERKLFSLLFYFYKLIICQDDSIKFVFKIYNIFTKILLLSLFANEKSLNLIMSIFKIFLKHNENEFEIHLFSEKFKNTYDLIFENHILQADDKNINNIKNIFFKFLISLPSFYSSPEKYCMKNEQKTIREFFKLKSSTNTDSVCTIILDFLVSMFSLPHWSEFMMQYVLDNLEASDLSGLSAFSPMDLLNANLTHFQNQMVVSNSKLNLIEKDSNFIPSEKDLKIYLKSGYFAESKKIFTTNMKTFEEKVQEYDSDDSDYHERTVKKTELITEERVANVVVMDDCANEENVKMNTPNYLLASQYEILLQEEAVDCQSEKFILNDKLTSMLCSIIRKKILEDKSYSIRDLLNYIKFVKYLTKVQKRIKNSEISQLVSDLCDFFSLVSTEDSFRFSLISLEHIESWLLSVTTTDNTALDFNSTKKFKITEEVNDGNSNQINKTNGVKKEEVRLNLGKILIDSKKFILYNNQNSNRIIVPFIDYILLYSSLNNNDYIKLIEDKVYSLGIVASLSDLNVKKQSNKFIIFTDDFIKSLFDEGDNHISIGENNDDNIVNNKKSESLEQNVEVEVVTKVSKDEKLDNTNTNINNNNDDHIDKDITSININEEKLKQDLKVNDNTSTKTTNKNKFDNLILSNFNLETCLFFVNNKYFQKFTKNMMTIGYDADFVNFNFKSNEEFTSWLEDKFINESANKEITTNKSDYLKSLKVVNSAKLKKKQTILEETDSNDIFNQLCKKFDLEDILAASGKERKVDKKQDKSDESIEKIEVKERELNKPKLFKDIYESFPKQGYSMQDCNYIVNVATFILQQQISLLNQVNQSYSENFILKSKSTTKEETKISDTNEHSNENRLVQTIITELSNLKLLFYQKYYNKAFFGHQSEFIMLKGNLHKIILFILAQFFESEDEQDESKIVKHLIGTQIFNYSHNYFTIKRITSESQDSFIKLVTEILFEILLNTETSHLHVKAEKMITHILNSLTKICEDLLRKTNLEGIVAAYDIFNFILQIIDKNMKKSENISEIVKRTIHSFNTSVFFNSILKYISEKASKKKTEFFIKSLEILMCISNLQHDHPDMSRESTMFTSETIFNIYMNLEILNKKLSSKYLCEMINQDCDEMIKLRSLEVKIPYKDESYSLILKSKLAHKMKIEANGQSLSPDTLVSMQGINNTNIGKAILFTSNSGNFALNLNTNKVMLTHDKTSSLKKKLFTNTKANNLDNSDPKKITKCNIPGCKELKKVVISANYCGQLAWVDNTIMHHGVFNTGDYSCFNNHNDLTRISESELIIELMDGCVITDKYVYVPGSTSQINIYLERVTSEMQRVAIPAGKKTIGARANRKNFVLWNSDGSVYVSGNNSEMQFPNTGAREGLKLFEIPSNLKCVDAYAMENSYVFLMQDTNLDNQCFIYASGRNRSGHCLLPESVSNKELSKVSDIPIVSINCFRNNLSAMTQENKFYYCGSLYDEYNGIRSPTIYGLKECDYFIKNAITILFHRSQYGCTFFKTLNRQNNEIEYYAVGYTRFLADSKKENSQSNSSAPNWDLPTKLLIFGDEKDKSDSKDNSHDGIHSDDDDGGHSEDDGSCSYNPPGRSVRSALRSLSVSHSRESSPEPQEDTKKKANKNVKEDFHLKDVIICDSMIFYIGDSYSSTIIDYPDLKAIEKERETTKNARNLIVLLNIEKLPHEELNKDFIQSYDNKSFMLLSLEGVEKDEKIILPVKKISVSEYETFIKSKEYNVEAELSCLFDPNSSSLLRITDMSTQIYPSNVSNFIIEKLSNLVNVLPISEFIFLDMKQIPAATNSITIKKPELPLLPNYNLKIVRNFNMETKDFYADLIDKSSLKILKSLNQLNENYIEEYSKSKKIYNKHNKNPEFLKYSNFNDYLQDKYSNFDKYEYMNEPVHKNIILHSSNIFTESAKHLILNVGIDFDSLISRTITNNMKYLDPTVRNDLFLTNLSSLERSEQSTRIRISRARYLNFKNRNIPDRTGEYSIFSQLYKELKNCNSNIYRVPLNGRLFKVELEGEHATDAGGPFRQIYTDAFENLQSEIIELLIPSPNNRSKSGLDRDKWTINPAAKSEVYLDMFKFLGRLFGYAILSELYSPLSLPSFVWKQIINSEVDLSDLEAIDVQSYNSIVKACLNPSKFKEELESLYDVIDFTCQLSNGISVDLVPNGKNVKLSESNYKEFIDLYLPVRMGEIREQIAAIQHGLFEIIPLKTLRFLSWEDLEEKVCGAKEFDLALLKTNTVYEGYKIDDPVVGFFWKFLESCTLEEKYLFLKFAWGRSRLPTNKHGFTDPFTIARLYMKLIFSYSHNGGNENNALPESHTCYFQIDLPNYTSYEILREKMLYAMKNSFMISDGEVETFEIEA